jgi:hypothetical protein
VSQAVSTMLETARRLVAKWRAETFFFECISFLIAFSPVFFPDASLFGFFVPNGTARMIDCV